MKRVCIMVLSAAAAIGLTAGCEWETSGKGNSWSDSYNWANFSGTYRSASGGILVSAYTKTSTTSTTTTTTSEGGSNTSTNTTIKTVTKTESGGTLPAKSLSASGTLSQTPIKPGSVTIKIGSDISLADNGAGALSGSGGTGTVSYDAGTWTFTLADVQWSALSRKITVSYAYTITSKGKSTSSGDSGSDSKEKSSTTTTTTTTNDEGKNAGSSGRAIYSFVVVQQGQNLTITDNNGATYTGRIGEMRSTSGATPETSKATAEGGKVLPKDGDTIVATFNCKGVSAAGMSVTITGTFQGTVASGVFTGRTMQGTWIEAGGKTGDINGTTVAVAIPTTETTTTTTEE